MSPIFIFGYCYQRVVVQNETIFYEDILEITLTGEHNI
jgi:hypothetical protein